ncbi:uncharacterized protein [Malus domestica]|uniref:uncharacterized protein isoform X3 n=1 Tax=Malus domestica TaxID=3750 RepID=UPI003975F60E
MVYNLPGGWQCLVAEVPVAYVRCAHLRLSLHLEYRNHCEAHQMILDGCSALTACLVWRMVQQEFWNCLQELGLFSIHGPLYFVGTKKFFSKMGLVCHIAKITARHLLHTMHGNSSNI